ncbi:MAG: hypothetical protein ACOZCF_05155 [Bacillota bacterium]
MIYRNSAIPLARLQVEAALKLYRHCKLWQTTDEALESLARSFPSFDFKSTLLKVAGVNALYGTQVYAVGEVAEHVHKMLEDTVAPFYPDIVEKLGRVKLGRGRN